MRWVIAIDKRDDIEVSRIAKMNIAVNYSSGYRGFLLDTGRHSLG